MTKDGLRRRNFHVTNIDATGSVNMQTNVAITGSLTVTDRLTLGGRFTVSNGIYQNYADQRGVIVNNISAESVISGGMWVTGSAASGTTPSVVAIPGPAAVGQPLGIALDTAASGANVSILTRGFYQGLVAAVTIAPGVGISAGSGTALNTALVGVAAKTRGTCIMGASSGGTISVYLW